MQLRPAIRLDETVDDALGLKERGYAEETSGKSDGRVSRKA